MKRPEPGPIGKTELDTMGCETPNCEHDHSILFLHPGCHPKAGLGAAYHKADGVVTLECAECETMVGAFWVGERPPVVN
jgi:hypothetical protein